ncbi:response regulator [Celeribacter halophilus]|uniref:response regulator n=1 Tax=Celeribacter halophilus TaxID=576117 RepID=UPI003A93EB0A
MRILIVDDDPLIRDLVRTVLRQDQTNEVVVAGSGPAALDILQHEDELFEMLMLDIEMPEMDGIELCRSIRKLPDYKTTAIVMLTRKSGVSDIEGAFAAGATDYITKPFDVKDIQPRLRIAQRKMRDDCLTVAREVLTDPTSEDSKTLDFAMETPVRITDVEQHTDPFSLGNYLSQLNRKKIDQSVVFAVQINSFNRLFATLSPLEVLSILVEVSEGISATAKGRRLLNAYFGSGAFLCISSSDALEDWHNIGNNINEILGVSDAVRAMDIGRNITVTVGRPFRPAAHRTQRVRKTFDRALVQLDRRAQVGKRSP